MAMKPHVRKKVTPFENTVTVTDPRHFHRECMVLFNSGPGLVLHDGDLVTDPTTGAVSRRFSHSWDGQVQGYTTIVSTGPIPDRPRTR